MLCTHPHGDSDSTAGVWELIRFGGSKFPGIEKAPMVFLREDALIEFSFGKTNILAVDIGKGKYDHHPLPDASGKNRVNNDECSTSIISKDLGLNPEEYPGLWEIIEYVRANDLRGIGYQLDFAYILKALNNQYRRARDEIDDEKVYQIAFTILDARLALAESGQERDNGIAISLIKEWSKERKIPFGTIGAQKIIGEMRNHFNTEIENGTRKDPYVIEGIRLAKLASNQIAHYLNRLENGKQNPFDFAEIYQGLKILWKDKDVEEIKKFAFDLLDSVYKSQRQMFDQALKDISQRSVVERVKRADGTICLIIGVESDEEGCGKLVRMIYRDALLIIQQNSNGRIAILPNYQHPYSRYLKKIMKVLLPTIRLEEQLMNKDRETTIIDRDRLSQPGKMDEIPEWYCQVEPETNKKPWGFKLLNGSWTNPAVLVTKILAMRILAICKIAVENFSEFDWKRWVATQIEKKKNNLAKGAR